MSGSSSDGCRSVARYWIIVDEHGKRVENVTYIDHPFAVRIRNAMNNRISTKMANKFYRLREGRTRKE